MLVSWRVRWLILRMARCVLRGYSSDGGQVREAVKREREPQRLDFEHGMFNSGKAKCIKG
jgi:hypothetical protein